MPTLQEDAYYTPTAQWPFDWTTTGPFFNVSMEAVEHAKYPTIYDSRKGTQDSKAASKFTSVSLDTVAAGKRNLTAASDFVVFEVVHADPMYWTQQVLITNVRDNTGKNHTDPTRAFDVFMVDTTVLTLGAQGVPTGMQALPHGLMPGYPGNQVTPRDDDQFNFYNPRFYTYQGSKATSFAVNPLSAPVELFDARLPLLPLRSFLYIRSKPLVSSLPAQQGIPPLDPSSGIASVTFDVTMSVKFVGGNCRGFQSCQGASKDEIPSRYCLLKNGGSSYALEPVADCGNCLANAD